MWKKIDEISRKIVTMTSANLAERLRCDPPLEYSMLIDQAFDPFDIWKEGYKAPRPFYETIAACDIITNNDSDSFMRYHAPPNTLDELGKWIGRRDTQISKIYMSAPNVYFADESQPLGINQKIQLHITSDLSRRRRRRYVYFTRRAARQARLRASVWKEETNCVQAKSFHTV